MRLIEQTVEILKVPDGMLALIEHAGRTCYKSDPEGDPGKFVKKIIRRGHESVIEHSLLSVEFRTSRSVTHELVRHRAGMSYSMESQRYVEYGWEKKGKDNGEEVDIEFVRPVWLPDLAPGEYREADDEKHKHTLSDVEYEFVYACIDSENSYRALRNHGCLAQEARETLNNSCATTIVVSGNLRAWRHMFNLRCSKKAHPQIRHLMLDLLGQAADRLPIAFGDLKEKYL